MGNIGDPITSGSIPAVGSTGTGYATNIDLFLGEVKVRLEAKVPLTSLLPGTFDLSNNPLNNAEWAGLYPQGAQPTTPTGTLQNYLGDLWWVNAGGGVKITSGTNLNAAGIGGIGGDYGGVNPALVSYNNANARYDFFANGGTSTYADVEALDFIIKGTAGTTKLACHSTVNTNQTVPYGLINSTDILAWDGAKLIPAGATNTYGTGLKLGGTLTATDIHWSASIQQQIPLIIAPGHGTNVAGGAGLFNITSQGTNYAFVSLPLQFPAGVTITQVTAVWSTVGAGTKAVELHSLSNVSGSDSGALLSGTSTSTTTPLVIPSTAGSVVTDTSHQYYIKVAGAALNDVINMVTFSYNKP